MLISFLGKHNYISAFERALNDLDHEFYNKMYSEFIKIRLGMSEMMLSSGITDFELSGRVFVYPQESKIKETDIIHAKKFVFNFE